MKLKLMFFILICSTLSAIGSTTVPGGIVSGTWTLAGSPYLLQGAIMIPNDSTLTIDPGVVVTIEGSYEILVKGRLLAEGTASSPISFIGASSSIGWLGIRFDSTASTNDTSRIIHCILEYGKAFGSSPFDCGGAVYLKDFSKVIISNSNITNCSASNFGGGIYCLNSNPQITYNTITDINNSGIYCDGSSPVIMYDTVTKCTQGGIYCTNQSNVIISHNFISSNTNATGGGITCSGGATISYNTVTYNAATDAFNSESGGGITCTGSFQTQTISHNDIEFNSAAGDGGGGICSAFGNTVITDNIIANNAASNYDCSEG